MKDKIFGVLQRVGRSFMLPIALLPVAGLLLGIGSAFTNPTTLETYGLTEIIKEGGAEAMAANPTTTTLGITTLQMDVFGGIIVGLGVAALHNRFYKVQPWNRLRRNITIQQRINIFSVCGIQEIL